MNSRVSWNVEGIDPSVRERAEAAARRAGMSLSDWLNSTIGEFAPPDFAPRLRPAADAGPGVARRRRHSPAARFHHPPDRTDFAPGAAPGLAAQRAGTSRARRRPAVERRHLAPRCAAVADLKSRGGKKGLVHRTRSARPTWSSAPPPRSIVRPRRSARRSLELAIAEITARQSELDNAAPRQVPPRGAPPLAPAMPAAPAAPTGPDFASLERHLFKITSQIEALQQPSGVEPSIAAFRGRTGRDSRRHHRGDAAPGDRIDRKRDPVAVPPHRRHPAERHRWPGPGGHRTRARRNSRSAALAEAGRTTGRLRRGDPQSRRQARH